MRGKNILWLTLIVALLSVSVVNLGFSQTTTMSVTPPLITGYLPGDSFAVLITISDASNVYSWEFSLSYAPYMDILAVTDVIEGPFLMAGGNTYMAKIVDHFEGVVQVGCTLTGEVPGVYGNGILAIVMFVIVEGGECALDLHDTALVDPDGLALAHSVEDGYYLGPTADLRKMLGTARGRVAPWTPGDSMELKGQVVNTGYAPIYARLKFTSVRDDGAVFTVYSGQHMWTTEPRATEYYYVNEFTPLVAEWDMIGTSPYLDAEDDGSYIAGYNHCELIGVFGFEDITLNPGDVIDQVVLEGYTQVASDGIDIDIYVFPSGAWVDSLWGGASWSWHTTRWVDPITSNICPELKTETGFNDWTIYIHCYAASDEFTGLDALRLRVEFTGVEGDPEYVYMDPYTDPVDPLPAIWDLYAFDEGSYITTVECEYRYNYPDPRFLQVWQTALNVQTFSWSVKG